MLINNKQVPPAWLNVLADVARYVPSALLAGGCLRDLALGGEVKDLDIFVPAGDAVDSLAWIYRNRGDVSISVPQGYTGAMTGDVDSVIGWRVPGLDLPVQLVVLKAPHTAMEVLRRMDYGACQVGIRMDSNHDFHLVMTDDCRADLALGVITLKPPQDDLQAARSVRRGKRFAAKYAGTGVVVDMKAADDFPSGVAEKAAT